MRFRLAVPVLLLFAVAAFANDAPTPGGPAMETGQPREAAGQPVEKAPARALGVSQEFVLPSGNIGCVYTPEGGTDVYQPEDGGPELSCDRVEPKYLRAILGRSGKAKVLSDVGDQGCCGADRTLAYGEVWRGGPFTCYSQRTGLTCERNDGHSFLLSRARVRAD